MDDRKYKESRDFIRMEIDTGFEFKIPGNGKTCKGTLKNLSHTGMQFVTSEEVSLNLTVDVFIDMGHNKFKPMEGRLTILRVEHLPDGAFLVAGKLNDIK